LINQTSNECITEETNQLKYEITGKTAMYNGSVRMFWSAPNYGYFDIDKVVKPTPIKYLKQVFNITGDTKQENFSINGKQDQYTEISEIFSVFETEVLDSFETEFLNFSKSIYDFDDELIIIFQKLYF
jgi:predicted ester cyclase